MKQGAALALFIALSWARAAHAQLPQIRGYYLNVPTWSDSTRFASGGLGDLNRLRLMTEPVLGPLTLQAAYEQLLGLTQRAGADPGAIFAGVVPGGGEWLPLQWTIEQADHIDWRHRFDRLNIRYAPGDVTEFVLGRQAISWATTLLLTPADPFVPFNPSDPFREYRAGVDALRVQLFPGPLSDLDFVVRPADFESVGETLTVVGRGRTVWRSWELSTWLGILHDEPALSVGAAGGIGSIALRGEAQLRTDENDDPVFRGTVGVDGLIDALGHDLYYVFEYQRDGFGASSSSDLLRVVRSDPFARGEMQVLGKDEIAGQGSYQITPLWTLNLLVLWNLNDSSALLAPGASYSLGSETTAQGGFFIGIGDDRPTLGAPVPSEYGLVPTFVYVSLTVFF